MLNQAQKTIILVAIFCVVAMILYPPWVLSSIVNYKGTHHKITYTGSYDFIWSPPASACFIDLYRLGVQLLGVLIFATGLCLVSSAKKQ